MNFISPTYAVFLLSLFILYWTVGQFHLTVRLMLLFVFSVVFYASLPLQSFYVYLLLGLILFNFLLGYLIKKNTSSEYQKWDGIHHVWNGKTTILLWVGIFFNTAILLGFKYLPFLLNNLADGLGFSDLKPMAELVDKNLIIPLGISFFTFENIAYLIDVYRGAPASNNFLQFASYKLFFPKLISGPITRYHSFSKYLQNHPYLGFENLVEGLWLIACGTVKKALIADRLGIFIDLCFGNLERASSFDLWLAIVAYGLQLYLDFSGYVDIARGSAKLLGIDLPENFNFPYFTTSIAQFWRHWHITLGDWLRNYLYFPLGGSRLGLIRTCVNLLIIMIIAGFWHGASWGFILWGVVHGVALVIHRLTDAVSKKVTLLEGVWESVFGVILAWGLTQMMVFFSWIIFRLPDLTQAQLVFQHFWNYAGDVQFYQKVYGEGLQIDRMILTQNIIGLCSIMALAFLMQKQWKLNFISPLKLAFVPLLLFVVWVFAPQGGLPYIYFDF